MKKQIETKKVHKFHSQERALQRYNKDYSKKDIKEMQKMLKDGNGIYVREANGDDRDVLYLVYKHIPLKVCYNYVENKIVTILPFDVDEYIKIEEEQRKKNNDS